MNYFKSVDLTSYDSLTMTVFDYIHIGNPYSGPSLLDIQVGFHESRELFYIYINQASGQQAQQGSAQSL